jgi:hypothetical protein
LTAHAEIPGTRLELACISLGAVLALLLFGAFSGRQTRFDDAGLGIDTLSCRAQYQGHQLHCDGFNDLDDCVAGVRARGSRPTVLWLGNSQLHGINQWAPGQEASPPILARRLRSRGIDLVALSTPNVTFQEYLVYFAYLKSRLPVRTLIVPLGFTSFRSPLGVRKDLDLGMNDPDTVADLMDFEIGRAIVSEYRSSGKGAEPALAGTVQEYSEERLTAWLERHLPAWAARAEVRGSMLLFAHNLRNTVFRITPQTKRRVIPGNYEVNMAALRATLELARRDGIDVIAYVAPIRDDYERPFAEDEYARFKAEVERVVGQYGATFANFESLVPSSMFGYMVAPDLGREMVPDFMHFQAGGHVALAEAMGDLIEDKSFGVDE